MHQGIFYMPGNEWYNGQTPLEFDILVEEYKLERDNKENKVVKNNNKKAGYGSE
jgi:hypothetical protein